MSGRVDTSLRNLRTRRDHLSDASFPSRPGLLSASGRASTSPLVAGRESPLPALRSPLRTLEGYPYALCPSICIRHCTEVKSERYRRSRLWTSAP
jgi:hypothetical protein